jgi:hypothetical protein
MIMTSFDGNDYQWETVKNLQGWFTKEELSGFAPLPTQAVLDRRECRLEELDSHDD